LKVKGSKRGEKDEIGERAGFRNSWMSGRERSFFFSTHKEKHFGQKFMAHTNRPNKIEGQKKNLGRTPSKLREARGLSKSNDENTERRTAKKKHKFRSSMHPFYKNHRKEEKEQESKDSCLAKIEN